ncbi:MAG: tRNA-dihydrouridine synthase [Patescibacteria group bacterium]
MVNFWEKLEKPILTTTPMAGITDSAWRQMCKAWGAQVVHTEFVSVDALYYDSQKSLKLLEFKAGEQPVVAQIFGKRAELYPKAAKLVASLGVAGLDINFGCPAKKVAGHGGGICLLRDMPTVKKIVANTIAAVDIPISIKSRISINTIKGHPDKGNITALDLVDALAEFPIAALIIHGRTYETPFTGPVDLEMLKSIKSKFKTGVFLINGSFQTVESVVADLKHTGADGIALSRSLYGRPWLFKQIRDYINTGQYQEITWPEIKKVAIQHADLLYESKSASGFKEMRKHLLFYVRGHPQASNLRKKLVAVDSPKDVRKIFSQI